ncbi:MAG: hypothetical protein PHF21_04475 [Bacilli bacterium]|nr:hypothetical protein [Bacilli bacterium]
MSIKDYGIIKRFMLFEFQDYYSCGGMGDFVESFDKLYDVIIYVNEQHYYTGTNIEILDLIKNKLYVLSYDWSCDLWKLKKY